MYNLTSVFATFCTALTITCIIDIIVLYYIAYPLFEPSLSFVLTPTIHYGSAFLSWVLLVLGIVIFIHRTERQKSYIESALYGAFWGFCVYGIYETTNFAIIRNWPFKFFLFDWAWGIVLSALISLIVRYLEDKS